MQTTDSQLQEFRKRIARARAQPRCVYPHELKHEIAEYAAMRRSFGAALRGVAAELGLSYGMLGRWVRHERRRHDVDKPPGEHTPIEGTPPDAPSAQNTASPPPVPAPLTPGQHEACTPALWLVVRAAHVHVSTSSRTALLRWLSALPPEAAPGEESP